MYDNPTVIILCGGKGERLRPLTNKVHKSLTKIGKKTIIHHLIDYFVKKRLNKFIFATGHKSNQIKIFLKKKFNKLNYEISDSGDVNIITRLQNVFKHKKINTIICYGDTLADINLDKYLTLIKKNENKIILTVYRYDMKFGVVDLDKKNIVKNFKEKPKMNTWINIGYIYIPKIMIKNVMKTNNFISFLQNEIKRKNVLFFKHNNLHITVNTITELNEAQKNIKKFYG